MLERFPMDKQPNYRRNNIRLFVASKSVLLNPLIQYIGFDVQTKASQMKPSDLLLFTSCGKDLLFTVVKKYKHDKNNVSLGYLVDCFSAAYRKTQYPVAYPYIEHFKSFEESVSFNFVYNILWIQQSIHSFIHSVCSTP